MKIAIPLLFCLVAVLAYFAYTSAPHNDWIGCPNVTWRPNIPVPIGPSELGTPEGDQFAAEIRKADAEIPLRTVSRIETARVASQDYRDQEILFRALHQQKE